MGKSHKDLFFKDQVIRQASTAWHEHLICIAFFSTGKVEIIFDIFAIVDYTLTNETLPALVWENDS